MNIEMLVLVGFALVTTTIARITYERHLRWKSAAAAMDRFRRLECLRDYQLYSTVAC
jgi:hypothetical protein